MPGEQCQKDKKHLPLMVPSLSLSLKGLKNSTAFQSFPPLWEMTLPHIPSCPVFKLLFWLLSSAGALCVLLLWGEHFSTLSSVKFQIPILACLLLLNNPVQKKKKKSWQKHEHFNWINYFHI
uniref:Uncharacterized protein n=1 Tax=Anas platyrhynchos TaxID=8839 RepID=A0A8B9QQP9_ANAPL